jgi:hypothetical protein
LFQPGTRLASFFKRFSSLTSRSSLPTKVFRRRWLSFSAAFFVMYVLLDRCTVYLQMWHGISAWYPPTGLAFAVFVGIGIEALPLVLLASYVAGFVNYHQTILSAEFLIINPLIPMVYFVAAHYLPSDLDSPHSN